MRKPILIGIGVLAALWGAWWALGIWEDRLLAEAEAKEAVAVQALAEKEKIELAARVEREAHEEERKAWAEQQAALTRSVLARNEATERRIAAALAPKSSEQVGKEARESLGIAPTPTATGFNITVSEMQQFVAMKIDNERLTANLKETEQQLTLERQANTTLRADLENLSRNLEQANKSIVLIQDAMEAYKSVAKKSKWRRALETGGKVGLAIAAGYLGAKAGSQ